MKSKNLRRPIIATLIFLLIAGVMIFVYVSSRSKQADELGKGSKTITVQVVIPEKETKDYVIKTDADFLRQALDQEKLIEGSEGEFGFFITGVSGVTADTSKQEWWCITKEGETVFSGVDEIVIQDKEQYEITLTTGY